MQKILITGGCGFIGSNFIRHILKNRDYHITNLDKLTYAGNSDNLKDIENHKYYSFIQGDIANKTLIDRLCEKEKFDGIINFAAETHVDRSIADSDPFIQTNIIGTHTLLKAAQKYNIKRYHQISTDEVYGDLGDNSTDYFTEDTPLAPNCPYASAKAAGDLLVKSWQETYQLQTIITRCSNNFGPYQFPEKLIPFFLFKAQQNENLPLYGDGKNIRDWLYVEDHCEAILLAFEKSDPGEIWNIGGHNEKNNIEIAQLITKATNTSSKIIFIPDRQAHDRRYAMDASKIENNLGWTPRHNFKQALEKTIDWYQKNKKWVANARKKV